MRFVETPIAGAYVVDIEPKGDERGFFARVFCEREFADRGLQTRFVQNNVSLSRHKGTLRGLHYQLDPSREVKLVRCMRGALYDVALDLRSDSPSFGRSFGVELTADNHRSFYVPEGVAHGFQTLQDDTEIGYMVSAFYAPERERGVRFDDPRFAVAWPLAPTVVSDRDRQHPDFDPAWHLGQSAEPERLL